METILIDGKKIREEILKEVLVEVSKLPFQPVFCDVLVGDDPASHQYVEMKRKMAEKVGIKFHQAEFDENISKDELVEEIKKIGKIENMCGLIVQLPLPEKLKDFKKEILEAVPEEIDVDCLGMMASKRFYENKNEIGYPAALACVYILESLNIDLNTKKIVIMGQGELVGKPVSMLLRFKGLEPKIVDSTTLNKEELLKEADIIISGIGKGKFITGDMLKKGAIVIDAGTSESPDNIEKKQTVEDKQILGDGKIFESRQIGEIVGDVDIESVKGIASYISPVPGGVGPVTVAMLLKNVMKVALQKNNIK